LQEVYYYSARLLFSAMVLLYLLESNIFPDATILPTVKFSMMQFGGLVKADKSDIIRGILEAGSPVSASKRDASCKSAGESAKGGFMDVNTFYAVTSATCFTLVGLWWSVVKSKTEWLKDEATRRLAGGVYASFLIPAVMSLGAQVGGENRFVWQAIFTVAALLGIIYTTRLMRKTRNAVEGTVSNNRWVIPVLYALILWFAIFPGTAFLFGMQPLQMEGILLCALILIAHLLTWEFMVTQAQK